MKYCIDCKKQIDRHSTRCRVCNNKLVAKTVRLCVQCHKETTNTKFCSISCSAKYNNKRRKQPTSVRNKIGQTLRKRYPGHGSVIIICKLCNKHKEVPYGKRNQKYCSLECRATDPTYTKKLSVAGKKRCSGITERRRLRDIGRKGGFGHRGYTNNKTRYDSKLEKDCFEFMENNCINFIAHKALPNSSKLSDIYLVDNKIWVELDGVNREKKKKYKCWEQDYQYWQDKLLLYKKLKLDYKIVYNFQEFKDLIVEIHTGRLMVMAPLLQRGTTKVQLLPCVPN